MSNSNQWKKKTSDRTSNASSSPNSFTQPFKPTVSTRYDPGFWGDYVTDFFHWHIERLPPWDISCSSSYCPWYDCYCWEGRLRVSRHIFAIIVTHIRASIKFCLARMHWQRKRSSPIWACFLRSQTRHQSDRTLASSRFGLVRMILFRLFLKLCRP